MTTTANRPATESTEPAGEEPVSDKDNRPGKQRMSLRTRVTLLAAICVAGAVALVSLGAFMTVKSNLYHQTEVSLLQQAVQEVHSIHPQLSPDGGYIFNIDQNAFTNIQYFSIIGPNGPLPGDGQLNASAVPANLIGQPERDVASVDQQYRTSAREVGNYVVVAVPYLEHTALVVAEPLTEQTSVLSSLSVVLFLISGAGIIVAALAGTVVATGGLRPVQRLTAATERVARTGDMQPIPVSGDDELARLTQSFNVMLGALAESREQQRRLVADAGHELRTPLTSLRTNLELLVASRKPGAPTLSEQDTSELYADVRGQLGELTQLIGDLVELARQDAPQVVHEPVDLVEVTERALDRARRRAGGATFDVRLQPWTLLGDASSLERAALNLLDNAVKFSPPEGVITVVLRPLGDGTAVFEVADQGPGIAEEDLPHVFERFYRSSEARTLPGSGLGLSIVAQAAQRHGGMVYARKAPGGGALMTLRLPGRAG